jgi:hypothetical protein
VLRPLHGLCSLFPAYLDANTDTGHAGDVDIPACARSQFPKSFVPQVLHDPKHLFTQQLANERGLVDANGIHVNTFDALEREGLAG